ncbi:MAG: ribosome small subunit-dependent GTPase A [Balneolaceae bacterium]|nr:ribosome small subunit-dependent GTPase A [Balneolaceae bacterium]
MNTVEGRIVESTGSWYEVAIFDDRNKTEGTIEARLPGRFRLDEQQVTNPLAVGDYVELSLNEDGTCSIVEIKERENYITRQATHGRQGEQILAANIDQAFVVQSVRKPKIKEGFIDRFLVTCEAYQLTPVILINKMDLAGEEGQAYVDELIELYTSLGYTILTCSIYDEESLETLKSHLKDQTSVFIGPSGVGKTSILNHIDPNIDRKVADVSEYSNKGKHTTTYAKLLPLHFGGYLVDTPGIREFGLVNIEPWELSLFFPEMLEPRQHCKFNNCTHSHEPKCGVIEAYENGEIDAGRYHSYLQMLESLKK